MTHHLQITIITTITCKKKRKLKVDPFRKYNGSILGQQPGALITCMQHTPSISFTGLLFWQCFASFCFPCRNIYVIPCLSDCAL